MPAYRDPFGDGSPGPFLTLRVSWNGQHRDILALVDTGADLTQIPSIVANALQLQQVDEIPVTSGHNDTTDQPIFVADIEFEGIQFPAVSILADEYPIALIGRDLLNELNTMLEGPAQRFSLTRP
jgi:predicted aspartyl protease